MICGSSHILGIDLQNLGLNSFQKNKLKPNSLYLVILEKGCQTANNTNKTQMDRVRNKNTGKHPGNHIQAGENETRKKLKIIDSFYKT
ncbi:hypothetical protein MAL08_04650 [Leptospira noguchii]|uniref:hypothetical protein n=1 Tax=Leptospira noguchii TaxID=28182 RepID=UPI0002BEF961|nr:hypothetical protein [Leptospira noguchii]EMI71573.1 hypothetical protein LEP1GSC072_2043 [Leptospira noguchii str. Bonito]UOG38612.1 hypothetical protein MAL08_04650 [Leptospira noguchii]